MAVGSTAARLMVRIGADTSELRRGLKRTRRRVKKTAKAMKSMGRKMSMFVTAPLAAAGGAAIKMASDTEEMQTKMQAVFQDATDDIVEWSETTADRLNRSSVRLQEYATSLQDTFVPMGVARDEATQMSKQVAELAVDLASFNNMAESQALDKLRSGLVGNHRALREFGSAINQSRLEQELMNQGIAQSVQNASEQEKMMARLSLIMQDTADAQGDAARTSGSFRNQMRGLKANAEQAAISIGQSLLPIGQKLIKWANTAISRWQNLSAETKANVRAFAALAAFVGPVTFALGNLLGVSVKVASVLGGMSASMSTMAGVAASFAVVALVVSQRWSEFVSFFSKAFSGIVDTFTSGATLLRVVWQKAIVLMTQAVQKLAEKTLGLFSDVATFAARVGVSAAAPWAKAFGVLESEASKATEETGKRLKGLTSATEIASTQFTSAFVRGFGRILTRNQFFAEQTQSVWDKNIGAIIGRFQDLRDSFMGGGFTPGGEDGGMQNILSFWDQWMTKTKEQQTQIIATRDQLRDLGLTLEQLKPGIDITDKIKNRFVSLTSQMGNAIQRAKSVGNAFKRMGKAAVRALTGMISKLGVAVGLAGVLTATGLGGLVGLGSGFSSIFKGLVSLQHGGLVMGPTLAAVGEGPGTSRSNPEVVAPLDKLQGMLSQVGGQQGGKLTARLTLDEIIFALERRKNHNRA